jgi:hypothetical protein
MKMKRFGFSVFSTLCAIFAVTMALNARVEAANSTACQYGDPQGGVTILATFTMLPYDYPIYREAVTAEIPIMERNGLKFVRSYRIMVGEMGGFVDIWWAPSYEAFYKAFYDPAYVDPKFGAFIKKTDGTLVSAHINIVHLEKFPPCH